MLKQLNKIFAFILITALMVGIALPTSVSAYVEAGTDIPNGEYAVAFCYVKDGTSDHSAADSFMVKDSGRLIVNDGVAVFEHEVLKANYATFAYLAARKAGSEKAAITTVDGKETATGLEGYETVTVRDAVNSDYVVVQFVIEDIWKKQDVLMHINDIDNYFGLPTPYNHWYNAQLEIAVHDITLPNGSEGEEEEPTNSDVTAELLAERIAEGYVLLDAAMEGAYDGTYPAGSKDKLLSKLKLAESLIEEDSDNTSILEAAYKIADQAIKVFEASVITIDKSRLLEWIAIANAWVEGKLDGAEREAGVPEDVRYFPVSDGEYLPVENFGDHHKGPVAKVKEQIVKVQLVVDNAEATQTEVNAAFNTANGASNWELLDKQSLVASDLEIIVLDSLEKDAQISPYAGDISSNAVILQQAGPGYYRAFANFAFFNTDNELTDTSIRSNTASAADGLFSRWGATPARAVKNPDLTNTPVFSSVLSGEHRNTIKVYQMEVRSGNSTYLQTDELWQGLWSIQYPMELPEAERKTVYISFNKSYLDALNELIAAANAALEAAKEGTAAGQHSAYHIEQLQLAVAAAEETGQQLSAPRPEILKATHALQQAVDLFESASVKDVYLSAAHSTDAVFSSLNDTIGNQARVVTNDDGKLQVSLKLINSSSVTEFKVKAGEQYVDTVTVSEDKELNERVVSFEVNRLDQLIDAQARVVKAEQDDAQAHSIRLNFNDVNNAQLYELIQRALSTYESSLESEKQGEYIELAQSALHNAIIKANEEAVRIPARQSDSDEAYARLSSALDTFKNTIDGGNTENPGTGNPGTGNPGAGNPGTGNPGAGSDPVYPADGNYYMDFRILKAGTDANSMAGDYVYTTALVKVKGSQRTVMFTVMQSAEIKSFTLNGQSEKVVSRDTKLNTRVTSFTLSSLSNKMSGTVRIDWDAFNYHHSYDIQFVFDEASAVAVTENNPKVPGSDVDGNTGVDEGKVDEYGGGNSEGTEDNTAEEETNVTTEGGNNSSTSNENTAQTKLVFSDVENHWAKASIVRAINLGIVNGYSDGSFRPNETVTRSEFAVMISRALKLGGEAAASELKDYATIPSWAQAHVARVIAKGIIQGYSDATFRPNEQLTRAQLGVMVARAASLALDEEATFSFADAPQIPAWAQKEVAAAVKAGLIKGKEDNRFDPNGTATRAEALTIIIRLLDL